MDFDIECLREAQVENVERLGRALGLKLPDKKRYERRAAYARELVKVVLHGLRRDAQEARRRERRGQS
ncbi:MAG TPA: hypothetical protein VLS89_19515 [Candidatus Nanopelagicales bacterium]|nr:hypothetical protein [Candidatus Nanopelagicales bacterium]